MSGYKPKPETILQGEIISFLKAGGFWHRRYNTGVFRGANGRPVRSVEKGHPDILARSKSGKVVWIEVKTQDGRLSPEQAAFRDDVVSRFKDAFVVARRVDDVVEAMA